MFRSYVLYGFASHLHEVYNYCGYFYDAMSLDATGVEAYSFNITGIEAYNIVSSPMRYIAYVFTSVGRCVWCCFL